MAAHDIFSTSMDHINSVKSNAIRIAYMLGLWEKLVRQFRDFYRYTDSAHRS
ncbi:putative phage HD domain protein [Salmonella phage SPFM1]|nr:putative phage HD domain protein [Salmonella phage SPFM1]